MHDSSTPTPPKTAEELNDELRREFPEAFRDHSTHKFGSKLSFEDRCGILAAFHMNVSGYLLAEAFGVDRRTVSHLVRPASPHYRNVRKEREKLGDVDFRNAYYTDSVKQRITVAMKERRESASMTYAEHDKENSLNHAAEAGVKANERAKGKEGTHLVKDINNDKATLTVRWFGEHKGGAGWRYNVTEHVPDKFLGQLHMPDVYAGQKDELEGPGFRTSQEAFDFALTLGMYLA